jgi:5,10-methylenetetrahydromethanopterin reductase
MDPAADDRPRLGLRMPPCESPDRVAEAIALAEALGFDSVWAPDSQLIFRDAFIALALAAVRTRRITLGTAVTNLVTRHVSVLAGATRSLQELAPGRIAIGLGAGASSTGMVGLPHSSNKAFGEGIAQLRALLSGEAVTLGGVEARLTGAAGPCPIYISAQGPLTLQLTGQAADGAILPGALAPGVLEDRLQLLAQGAAAAGRSLAELDVAVWATAHVTDDLDADLKLFKPVVVNLLPVQPEAELVAAGITERLNDRVPPFPAGFEPDGLHIRDWATAVEACDSLVSDDLARRWVEAFALVGSAKTLPAKLAQLRQRGITTLIVTPLVGDNSQALPIGLMRELSAALGLAEA